MRKIIFTIATAALLFSSCNLDEVNTNPNDPVDVPLKTLLPAAQKGLADALGGRFFRYTGILSQQLDGQSNQELNFENYNPDELFVGYAWDDFYSGSMIHLRIMIDQAVEEGSPHYEGVGKILLATALGAVTDTWGDIPYTEALLGGDNLAPAYDGQQAIYTEILNLLTEGIEDVQAGNSVLSPTSDDVIYGGDMAAWATAAHALKARYLIHQTKVDAGVASEALMEAQMGFSSEAGDMNFVYEGSGSPNPIFVFFSETENAFVDPQYLGVLGSQDLRFDDFVDLIPFTGGASKVGEALGSTGSPIWMMSYVEQEFIKAEAHLRANATSDAQDAMHEAIRASVRQHTGGLYTDSEIEDFVATHVLTGDFESDLDLLMNEKFAGAFYSIGTMERLAANRISRA